MEVNFAMDTAQMLQDIISGCVSGIATAAACGLAAWIIYATGIKGKERSQLASERKNNIFVPLKYEMKRMTMMADDIWQDINMETVANIVDKEDEYVVDTDLYSQCEALVFLIRQYEEIDTFSVAKKIIWTRFIEKYAEIYGSARHLVSQYVFEEGKEVMYEEYKPAIWAFFDAISERRDISYLFQHRGAEEVYQELGYVGPVEEYLAKMFGRVLPRDDMYNGICFENVADDGLIHKKITPAEYMAKGFDFFRVFDEEGSIRRKAELLSSIKQLAFEIYELTSVKIRSIVEKYEKE